MAEQKDAKTTNRRDFLKLATVSAPAAVAAVAGTAAQADTSTAETHGSGLADTEHTRAYYDTARF